jgi:serine/threonine protein kinase
MPCTVASTIRLGTIIRHPMPLTPGLGLGPYEITAPAIRGSAAMWPSRFCRPDLASDPSRRQRFETEARAVAALNHPNIVALYDVGDGYIVSELVDGRSLRGAKLSLRKAIDAGVQIAAGLAAAHAAGITHPYLKPENILLTRDRRVKILDFGLAKMAEPQSAATAIETMTVGSESELLLHMASHA